MDINTKEFNSSCMTGSIPEYYQLQLTSHDINKLYNKKERRLFDFLE